MKKLLIIGSVSLLIITAVFFAALSAVKSQLRKKNITYKTLDFHFPSSLYTEKLKYDNDTISLEIKQAGLSWSWLSLLTGKPAIKDLTAEGVRFKQISGKGGTGDQIKIPRFSVKNLNLKNIYFESDNGNDTLILNLSDLYISAVESDESIVLDTLKLNSTDISYLPGKPGSGSSDSSSFLFSDIPSFEIKSAVLRKCSILFDDSENKHIISNLDFRFNGLKSSELLNFGIDRLAFTYQDTLNLDIVLGNGVINEKLNTTLNDLRFRLPGAGINIKKIDLKTSEGLNAAIILENSYISFGRIRQLYKGINNILNPEIPSDSLVFMSGNLGIKSKSASATPLLLRFYRKTSANINGTADWSGKSPVFNFDINPVKTSRSDLDLLLPKESYNKFFKWPTGISGKVNIKNPDDKIEIAGVLNTDQGVLKTKTIIKSGVKDNLYYSLDIQSDSVRLGDIETILPVKIPYAGIHFYMDGESNTDETTDYFNLKIDGRNLFYRTKLIDSLSFSFYSGNDADTIKAEIEDELALVNFKMILPADESAGSSFSGRIRKLVPSGFYESLPEGSLSAGISGNIGGKDSTTEINVDIKSVEFSTQSEKIKFPDSHVLYSSDKEHLFLTLSSGDKKTIDIKTGKVFPKFKIPVTEWLAEWPESEIGINMNIAGNVFYALTGHTGSLDLQKLELIKDNKNLTTNFSIPYFQYDSIIIKDLTSKVQSEREKLTGNFNLKSISNPGISVEDIALDLQFTQKLYAMKLSGFFSDARNKYQISVLFNDLDSGYLLRLNEADALILSDSTINVVNNSGIEFTDSMKITRGNFIFGKNGSLLKASTDGQNLRLTVDSLKLDPLLSFLVKNDNVKGSINADGLMNTKSGAIEANGEIYSVSYSGSDLGRINFKGSMSEKNFTSELNYDHKDARLRINFNKSDNKYNYTADLRKIDMGFLKNFSFIPNLGLTGRLSGVVKGVAGSEIKANGMLISDSLAFVIPVISTKINFDRDTIFINGDKLTFNNFLIRDEGNNDLTINGDLRFSPRIEAALTIKSKKFQLLNSKDPDSFVTGKMEVSADLKISGGLDKVSVSGVFKTLPGASVNYTTRESFGFVDASQIVTFTDFNEDAAKIHRPAKKINSEIDWNVDLEISNTRMEILLDEVSQEYVKLTGSGKLKLRKGVDNTPLVYGSFLSESGSAFIKPPAVPDLDLTIEKAGITWSGMIDEPVISFKGYKSVKASPKGLSPEFSTRSNPETFRVMAILDQVSLSQLELEFDLDGGASDTKAFIQSLPKDTRESYAINLLVFGKLGSEDVSGSSAIAGSVSGKLNEISRRNLKNTDLSFSANSYKEGTPKGTEQERTDLNYSLSKGFMNNRLSFSVGGSMGIYMDNLSEAPNSNLIGNIEINYKIKEKPSIDLRGSRKDIYGGIIDGDVTQNSLGLYIQKSYPRFSDFLKPKKKVVTK